MDKDKVLEIIEKLRKENWDNGRYFGECSEHSDIRQDSYDSACQDMLDELAGLE